MQNTIDQKLFSEACYKMIGALQGQNGIGTLREKTIHSVLKYYYAPDPAYHEIRIGSYVADICVDGEIYEVQTPKWLSWLDMETGELSPKRRSPKTGTIYQIIPELYRIKMFIGNPRLHFIISLIDVEETRYLNGWGRNKKRGSSRMDGIPVGIFDEVRIDTFSDYMIFLPDTLPGRFTSKDLAKAVKISQGSAGTLLNVLLETRIIDRVGKSGNSYLYQKIYTR